ncbi:hypothetical protein GCM10025869_14370 [Homoserinibacter gongjuensis]|uniref:Uncharacterized protein n=2 Tax=Homoserinibacter gongjuensis TaxID=1162968 RepID=A0ABQ6JRZ5_9MICO|nr:hypothetical protein GCM10025869_14370 [Homoserinibacter gongjuensis]
MVAAVAGVAALGMLLTGCSFAEQYQQVVDDISHTQQLQADFDRLVGDIREQDGVESVSADSALAFAPRSASIAVRMRAESSPAQWRAVADSVMVAAAAELAEVEFEVAQQTDALHLEYPAAVVAGLEVEAEVELAARLEEAIGPGLEVHLIRAAPSWSRVIGAIDRADTSVTHALVANTDAVRAAVASAPELTTQWLLPGLSFMGGLPPDAVLALVGQSDLALPPNILPGDDDSGLELPDEAVWFGYHLNDAAESVVIGALFSHADTPSEAEGWARFLQLVSTAVSTVDGVLIVNVQWATSGGIVSRTTCVDGIPTATAGDDALLDSLASGGLEITGMIAGYCAT